MRIIIALSTALLLSAAPAAHAQILGGVGGIGGALNGTVGGTFGTAGSIGGTLDGVRSGTSGTLNGATSSAGSQNVDRKSGRVHATAASTPTAAAMSSNRLPTLSRR